MHRIASLNDSTLVADAPEQGKNILWVDSRPFLLVMARRVLSDRTQHTWNVVGLDTYDAILSAMMEQRVDAFVLDADMPGEDIGGVIQMLAEQFPSVPKIVLTAKPISTVRSVCLERGARGYLQKPTNADELDPVFSLLNQLFDSQRQRGFHGYLWIASLYELLQLECLHRRSSVLRFSSGPQRGAVYIDRGEIIHAEVDGLRGMEALAKVLSLSGGEFHRQSFEPPLESSLAGRWESILMEAAQQQDEAEPESELQAEPVSVRAQQVA